MRDSTKDVSSNQMYVVTRHLAAIRSQSDGDAAVALLSDIDRLRLSSALSDHSKKHKISIGLIAKDIGVGRTYLYGLLDSNQIELSRLESIQNYLNIRIISDSVINAYSKELESSLNGRSYSFNWRERCFKVQVSGFYLSQFLLPSLKSQTTFFEHLISLAKENAVKSNNNKYVIDDTYKDEILYFNQLIEFCNIALEAIGQDDIFDDFVTSFEESYFITLPIALNRSFWCDIEEGIEEIIFEKYDNFPDQPKSKEAREEKRALATEKKLLMKYHKAFLQDLYKKLDQLAKWEDKIQNYIDETSRVLRKDLYLPLEIEELANNLERGTIPLKIQKETKK